MSSYVTVDVDATRREAARRRRTRGIMAIHLPSAWAQSVNVNETWAGLAYILVSSTFTSTYMVHFHGYFHSPYSADSPLLVITQTLLTEH